MVTAAAGAEAGSSWSDASRRTVFSPPLARSGGGEKPIDRIVHQPSERAARQAGRRIGPLRTAGGQGSRPAPPSPPSPAARAAPVGGGGLGRGGGGGGGRPLAAGRGAPPRRGSWSG